MKEDACADCGLEAAHGVVLLSQTQTIGKRRIEFVRCGRCWIKAGSEVRDELARSAQAG